LLSTYGKDLRLVVERREYAINAKSCRTRYHIRHLLGQAEAMHQAAQIRSYVAAIQEANKTAPQPMSEGELHSWTQWALSQADRIDPVVSGAYRTRPSESE
jgi:hypothetical protein